MENVKVRKTTDAGSHFVTADSPAVESAAMEAVPRMPMIWLDLKEAGEFQFSPSVRQVSWVGERSNSAEGESQLNKD